MNHPFIDRAGRSVSLHSIPCILFSLFFGALSLTAQDRDFRAERFVLDDDAADGAMHRLVLQTDNPLLQDVTLTIPDPGMTTSRLLLARSASTQLVEAPLTFTGTLDFGSATLLGLPGADVPVVTAVADPDLSSERRLVGGTGVSLVDNGPNSTMSIAIGQEVGVDDRPVFTGLQLDDDLDMQGGTIVDLSSLESSPSGSLSLDSDGSVTINLDENDDGTGSSLSVEANGSSSDLLTVSETGLTTIVSSSGTGGLRVRNTNGGGTTRVLELGDGSATLLTVRRNGNVGLGIGTSTPAARIEIENSSGTQPAIRASNTDASGVALEVADGSIVAEVVSVAANGTIPDDAVVADALGTPVSAPAGGNNGQILYVVNTTGGAVVLSGLATDGTNTSTTIPRGGAATILRVGGAWYAVDRN